MFLLTAQPALTTTGALGRPTSHCPQRAGGILSSQTGLVDALIPLEQ